MKIIQDIAQQLSVGYKKQRKKEELGEAALSCGWDKNAIATSNGGCVHDFASLVQWACQVERKSKKKIWYKKAQTNQENKKFIGDKKSDLLIAIEVQNQQMKREWKICIYSNNCECRKSISVGMQSEYIRSMRCTPFLWDRFQGQSCTDGLGAGFLPPINLMDLRTRRLVDWMCAGYRVVIVEKKKCSSICGIVHCATYLRCWWVKYQYLGCVCIIIDYFLPYTVLVLPHLIKKKENINKYKTPHNKMKLPNSIKKKKAQKESGKATK